MAARFATAATGNRPAVLGRAGGIRAGAEAGGGSEARLRARRRHSQSARSPGGTNRPAAGGTAGADVGEPLAAVVGPVPAGRSARAAGPDANASGSVETEGSGAGGGNGRVRRPGGSAAWAGAGAGDAAAVVAAVGDPCPGVRASAGCRRWRRRPSVSGSARPVSPRPSALWKRRRACKDCWPHLPSTAPGSKPSASNLPGCRGPAPPAAPAPLPGRPRLRRASSRAPALPTRSCLVCAPPPSPPYDPLDASASSLFRTLLQVDPRCLGRTPATMRSGRPKPERVANGRSTKVDVGVFRKCAAGQKQVNHTPSTLLAPIRALPTWALPSEPERV